MSRVVSTNIIDPLVCSDPPWLVQPRRPPLGQPAPAGAPPHCFQMPVLGAAPSPAWALTPLSGPLPHEAAGISLRPLSISSLRVHPSQEGSQASWAPRAPQSQSRSGEKRSVSGRQTERRVLRLPPICSSWQERSTKPKPGRRSVGL